MPAAFDLWLADLEQAPRRASLEAWKRRLAVGGDLTFVDRVRWLHALLRHGLGGDGKAPERLAFLDRCGLLDEAWALTLDHPIPAQRSLLGQLIQDRRPGPGQVDRWAPWIEQGWEACAGLYHEQPALALAHWRSLVRQPAQEEALARAFVQRFPQVFNQAHPIAQGLDHWTRGLPLHRQAHAWAWALEQGCDPFALSQGYPHWEHAARAGLQAADQWARHHVPEAWQAYRDQRFCERLSVPLGYGISPEIALEHQEKRWQSRSNAATVRDREGRPALWHALRRCPGFVGTPTFSEAYAQTPPAEACDLARALVAGWLEQSTLRPSDLRPALDRFGGPVFETTSGVFLLTPAPNLPALAHWSTWDAPADFWWGGNDGHWQDWLRRCLALPANQQRAWVQVLTQGPYLPEEIHPFLRGLVVALDPQALAWQMGATWPVGLPWPEEWPEATQDQLRTLQRRQALRERPAPVSERSRRRV